VHLYACVRANVVHERDAILLVAEHIFVDRVNTIGRI